MNKTPPSHEQELDQQLAEFTDQVLSEAPQAKMDDALSQTELVELQKAVLQLKVAAHAARPNAEAQARVRARLLLAWKQNQPSRRPIWKQFPWPLPRPLLAGGLAVLSLIGVGLLFVSGSLTTTPLIGTAEGSPVAALLFIVIGVAIVAWLLWRDHQD